jgi:hypothetical protein
VSIRRRLKALEAHSPDPEPSDRSEVRARMKESLDRIARLRRGELDPEEAAEVEREAAAVERRMAQRRGEGGR